MKYIHLFFLALLAILIPLQNHAMEDDSHLEKILQQMSTNKSKIAQGTIWQQEIITAYQKEQKEFSQEKQELFEQLRTISNESSSQDFLTILWDDPWTTWDKAVYEKFKTWKAFPLIEQLSKNEPTLIKITVEHLRNDPTSYISLLPKEVVYKTLGFFHTPRQYIPMLALQTQQEKKRQKLLQLQQKKYKICPII